MGGVWEDRGWGGEVGGGSVGGVATCMTLQAPSSSGGVPMVAGSLGGEEGVLCSTGKLS